MNGVAAVTALSEESQDRPRARTDDAEVEAEARVTERIITFSDGVIAIAITLLALALPIPDATHLTNVQLLQVIQTDWPDYFAFLLSFVVIGNQWATHRRVCRYVDQMTGWVGKLNMVWLLMMVLTPFAAKMLAGGGGSSASFGVRFAIYTLVQVIAEACLMLMSREAQLRHMLRCDAPESARRPDSIPYLAVIITLLVSIPVAFAVGGFAFMVWIAISLTSRGLRLLMAHGRHATGDGAPGSRPFSGRNR
jgi:uncharacterized membrane protein